MTFLVCPKCKNKYNIEINKIPEKGVNIECEFCHEIWFVKKNDLLPESQKKQIVEPQSRYFQESDEYISRAVNFKGNAKKKFAGDDFIKKVYNQTKEEKINKFRRRQPTNIQMYLQKQMGDYDLFTELYSEDTFVRPVTKTNETVNKKVSDKVNIFSESDKESFDKYLKSIASSETALSGKPILTTVLHPNNNEDSEKNIKYKSISTPLTSNSDNTINAKEEIIKIIPEGAESEYQANRGNYNKRKFPIFSVLIGIIIASLAYLGIEYNNLVIEKYHETLSYFETFQGKESKHSFSIEESTTYTKNFNNEPYLWIKLKLTNVSDEKKLLTPVNYTIMNSDNQILDSDKISFPDVELSPNESYVTDRILIPYNSNITYKLSLNID